MAEETDNVVPAAGNRLPSLPKKRASGPFQRLEELTEIVDPPQDLRLQAQRDPRSLEAGGMSIDPAKNTNIETVPPTDADRHRELSADPAAELPQKVEHMVLQTTVPLDKAQAFKMHCIRNRTTVREELRRLVDQVVSALPAER
ncbi:conserved hypothetical protein [Hyphomicrobiales bacterium]|jgi:hypothetical protein|nr:hypothetical protein [Pseudomonadota bacterium]CAH1696609.1 conserved hypothetical protein [Hyphomicrobiales bacterium]CAH1696646.1 conserved hypothetical protein [Hyphomicrobiales bacterium]